MSNNVRFNERGSEPLGQTGITGTVSGTFNKGKGAIMGLIVKTQTTANLTFEVSEDGTTWYPLTPPTGDFTGVTSTGKAFPAEWLACFAPYKYFRVTFSASQSGGGATILAPLMA